MMRDRLRYIAETYGVKLAMAVLHRESARGLITVDTLIQRFAKADPTSGKARTQWLVKTYIADKHFKLEDLGRAYAALMAFQRSKRTFSKEQRELFNIKTLHALEALVDPILRKEEHARLTRDLSSLTGRHKRRLEECKAREESLVIQEGAGLTTIVVPITEFAAKWWGRGTKWCTAAENNNAFQHYHTMAPLVILIDRDGAKFQIHITKHDIQIRDAADYSVPMQEINNRWHVFKPLIYWGLTKNSDILEWIPKQDKTPAFYQWAIRQNSHVLQSVPQNQLTYDFCRLAIKCNGMSIMDIPKNFRTPDMYRLAVEQNGLVFILVPTIYQTLDLCRLALERHGNLLIFLPEVHRTPDFYRLAVKQDGQNIAHVPVAHRTQGLCQLAITCHGLALQYVPLPQCTKMLCIQAVEHSGCALKFVPEEYQTQDLWETAVHQNGKALQFVPPTCRHPDLCRVAVQQDGLALSYVPKTYQTLDLCCLAVEQAGLALEFVLEHYKTHEICKLAVESTRYALQYVPKSIQDDIQSYLAPDFILWTPAVFGNLRSYLQHMPNLGDIV
jgi:hypothetical protein